MVNNLRRTPTQKYILKQKVNHSWQCMHGSLGSIPSTGKREGREREERGEKKCTVNKNSGLFANEDGLQSLKRTIYS
jgi:hypothetical protein